MKVYTNPRFPLFNVETGFALSDKEAKIAIFEVAKDLNKANPTLLPLSQKDVLSVNCNDGTHLVLLLNFVAIPSLQCEFTARLKHKGIAFAQLSKGQSKNVQASACVKDVASLLPFATLKIGTIGVRSTNRDMSYELEISDVHTDKILTALQGHVAIENNDQNNVKRTFGYVLTCRNEVEAFMLAAGKANLYEETVIAVQAYQERHNMKDEYESGRISEKGKELAYTHTVNLGE